MGGAGLVFDNLGICRFHRAWLEGMIPEIINTLFGNNKDFLKSIKLTAGRISSRNASVFREASRNADFVYTFLKKCSETQDNNPDLKQWLERFETNTEQAAIDFWYEMHKGAHETLREFPD